MFFRAYVGKSSFTDHDDLSKAQAVPGAIVVAINGGVMVPVNQVKIPDFSPIAITLFSTILLITLMIPIYVVWMLS